MTLICEIYRCSKKEGMYIYIAKSDGVDSLPDELKQVTGRLDLAMTLNITPEKKLARASAENVIGSIKEKGYYLQSPPSLQADQLEIKNAINEANNFLER